MYPTGEKGNIYYSDVVLNDTKSDVFMKKYKEYIYRNAKNIQKQNTQAQFMCFNSQIKKICSDFIDINIVKENDEKLLESLNDKFCTRDLLKGVVPMLEYDEMLGSEISYMELKKKYESNSFVVQAAKGSGGSGTYYIDSQKIIGNLIEKEKNIMFRNI